MKAATEDESGDTLYVSYSYVKAEQTIEVDQKAPGVKFEPNTGDTQNREVRSSASTSTTTSTRVTRIRR